MENKELKFGDEVVVILPDEPVTYCKFIAYSLDKKRCAVFVGSEEQPEIWYPFCERVFSNENDLMRKQYELLSKSNKPA